MLQVLSKLEVLFLLFHLFFKFRLNFSRFLQIFLFKLFPRCLAIIKIASQQGAGRAHLRLWWDLGHCGYSPQLSHHTESSHPHGQCERGRQNTKESQVQVWEWCGNLRARIWRQSHGSCNVWVWRCHVWFWREWYSTWCQAASTARTRDLPITAPGPSLSMASTGHTGTVSALGRESRASRWTRSQGRDSWRGHGQEPHQQRSGGGNQEGWGGWQGGQW